MFDITSLASRYGYPVPEFLDIVWTLWWDHSERFEDEIFVLHGFTPDETDFALSCAARSEPCEF